MNEQLNGHDNTTQALATGTLIDWPNSAQPYGVAKRYASTPNSYVSGAGRSIDPVTAPGVPCPWRDSAQGLSPTLY